MNFVPEKVLAAVLNRRRYVERAEARSSGVTDITFEEEDLERTRDLNQTSACDSDVFGSRFSRMCMCVCVCKLIILR